jgi:hypothetical protein
VVAGVGAVNLGTATVFGIAAGTGAAVVAQNPVWLAVGSVLGLLVGIIVERRRDPKP